PRKPANSPARPGAHGWALGTLSGGTLKRTSSSPPPSRRSRGRIQPSVATDRSQHRVRVFDSTESPHRNLQEKRLIRCKFRQIQMQEFAAFPSKNQQLQEFSQSTSASRPLQAEDRHRRPAGPSRRLPTPNPPAFRSSIRRPARA